MLLHRTRDLHVDVYGSLAATGNGHGTFTAILLGLEACDPELLLPDHVEARIADIEATGILRLGNMFGARTDVRFTTSDITRHPLTMLQRHPNGMRFRAADEEGRILLDETWFSVGGGFVLRDGDEDTVRCDTSVPYPFESAAELLSLCREHGVSIADVMLMNELAWRAEADVTDGLLRLWHVMQQSVRTACGRTGVLPGGLNVPRRAPSWYRRLQALDSRRSPGHWMDWVNLVALAVNEENASGGRVVTAPTNGAAGIIPAVLHYATWYSPAAGRAPARDRLPSARAIVPRFLLTAGAIGSLYKERASISGAEVGCQGEVGSASSMAAAGLAEILGGTPEQVENAAEIAMEHNLGLTCDPIGGLVQIPCIERNAVAAVKAVNAARISLWGDGTHLVSLDQVIATMVQTGRDMNQKYKETALGGLAVNAVDC